MMPQFHGARPLHTLINGLDVFLRNHAALDVVDELVTSTRSIWLDTQLAMSVVARTTGLANVLALGFSSFANRLLINNLKFAYLYSMSAKNPFANNLHLQLILATDQQLPIDTLHLNLDSRVFAEKSLQHPLNAFALFGGRCIHYD